MKKFILSSVVIVSFAAYAAITQILNVNRPLPPAVSAPLPSGSQTSGQTAAGQASGGNPPAGASNNPGSGGAVAQKTTPPARQGLYKNGNYIGSVADAYYGNIQVEAVVQNGRLADVQILQYPNDRSTSIMINSQALPYLRSEAIQAQSASVDIISGATDTSMAFQQSLASALSAAQA